VRKVVGVIVVALVAPVTIVSCRRAPFAPPSAPAASGPAASVSTEERARWVLIDPTAVLREQPDDGMIGVRAEVDDAKARALRDDDRAFALFLRGQEQGDFVSIHPVSEAPHGYSCAEPPASLAPYAITLWVRRSGLARVTTRRVRTEFEDGTTMTVAAGVVLHDGDRVRVDPPIDLKANVPSDSVATSFYAQPSFDNDRGFSIGSIDGSFRLAGKEWGAEVLEDQRAVYARRASPKGPLLSLRTRCAQYEVLASGEPEDLGFGGLGLVGTGAGSGVCEYAPSGVPVYFASGVRAGVTRKALRIPANAGKDRACFRPSLADDGGEHQQGGVRSFVELCVARKDIERGSCPE